MIFFLDVEGFQTSEGRMKLSVRIFSFVLEGFSHQKRARVGQTKAFSGGISTYGMNLGIKLEGKKETQNKKKQKKAKKH